MCRFYGVDTSVSEDSPFVVSSSNYERTLRLAQGERDDDFYDDEEDEDEEREWCD